MTEHPTLFTRMGFSPKADKGVKRGELAFVFALNPCMQVRVFRLAGALLIFAGLNASGLVSAQTVTEPEPSSVSTAAPNAIRSISANLQGGIEVIRIDLAMPLKALPQGFSLQAPARIALDFPGVTNALGRSAVELNIGNLRSATVVEVGKKSRVVLNLKSAAAYQAQIQGNALLITLDVAALALPSSKVPPAFGENANRDAVPLKGIDFRRGPEGAGRVVVDLANNQVGVDIRQQGQALVVEFLKTALPESLRRRLNVADFGTPIQNVTSTQSGDRVRMVVEPAGQWEHSAYQTDSQFVLEVRPRKDEPGKLTPGAGYNGEKLSLNFQNIETRALLQVIADFTNLNIVTTDTVTGAVTLRLKDVPWDQALEIILQAKGLDMRKSGNVLRIAPKEELAAKDKVDLESRNALQGLEQLRTQDFRMNYAKADEIAKSLMGAGTIGATRILSARGSVIAEARTNQLFVTDIPSRLEQVQNLIGKLDIPVRQVMIEARIVEAADTFGKSIGVRLGGRPFTLNGGRNVSFGSSYASGEPGTGAGDFVNLPGVSPDGSSLGAFAISLFNSSASRLLNLEISALESDGKGKIVSSPRIVTADQVKALIEQGTELPYQQSAPNGATTIAFRKANLKLEVTPQITPEGSIILNVDVNKDSVGRPTTNGFAIDTKHIQTQVLVENGGTVVIGGIFEQTERDDETKVPFLGDIPGLGHLFKTRTRNVSKSELLVFITPKMLTDSAALR